MINKNTAWRAALFALLGLQMEVCFVALSSAVKGGADLRGATSLWMAPVYAVPALGVATAARRLRALGLPLPARALVYMSGIYAVELASGILFNAFGLRVWDYSAKRFNFRGYVTASYAPFWYALGLALEWVDGRVSAAAGALAGNNQDPAVRKGNVSLLEDIK